MMKPQTSIDRQDDTKNFLRIWAFGLLALLFAASAQATGEYASAIKLGAPNTKIMGCSGDGFWDPRNGGECWTCNGGDRTVFPVTGNKACQIKAQNYFSSAAQLTDHKNECTGSSFLDPLTGACWTCPKGTKRSLKSVKGDKACFEKIPRHNRKAGYEYTVSSLLKSCKKGTFANVGSRKCYSCPKGWKHDPSKTVGANGVCYKPAYTAWHSASKVKTISLSCSQGFYDPINGGSCWTCPTGYQRHITAVNSDKACIKRVAPSNASATFIGGKSFDFKQVAKGAVNLGCAAYGKAAFFDLKEGGTCWTCPKDQPSRTIFPVDHPKACASSICGKENGRPCYVWERIPSCDKGLIEDPFTNQCVQPKNLACTSYVKTLAAMKKAADEARAAGSQLQEGALDRIPGARSLIKFTQNQISQVDGEVDKLASKVDMTKLLDPLQDLAAEDPAFIRDFFNTAKALAAKKEQIASMFLDHNLICGGDIDKIAARAMELGLGDLVKSHARPRNSIQMAQWEGAYPFPLTLTDASPASELFASRIIGPGSRNRVVLDFTMDFPYQKGMVKAVFTPGLQIAISLDDPLKGGNGLYFMAGGTVLAAKAKNPLDPSDQVSQIPDLNIGLGFQWGGPDRDADHACHKSGVIAAGGTIKILGVLGIGINDCPVPVSGFGVSFGSVKLGTIDEIAEKVFDVALATSTITPSGESATVAAPFEPVEKSVPAPEGKSTILAPEGEVLTPDTPETPKKSRYKLPGSLEGGGGGEISIRLLPTPWHVEKFTPGGIF